jgi:hypothetical protein
MVSLGASTSRHVPLELISITSLVSLEQMTPSSLNDDLPLVFLLAKQIYSKALQRLGLSHESMATFLDHPRLSSVPESFRYDTNKYGMHDGIYAPFGQKDLLNPTIRSGYGYVFC